MASDTVHVGQLICDSTTPPPDRGFYKINDTTTGHVGKLVMSDPVSGPTVTKWQFVQACVDAGITEAQIDTAVALLTAKRQRFWKHTQIIDRDNPFSSGLRSNLTPVPTPAAWNAIFLAAAALDPLTV